MYVYSECALWEESSKKNFFARFARSKFFFAQIKKHSLVAHFFQSHSLAAGGTISGSGSLYKSSSSMLKLV
mgnify:CR=1 FL=1